MRARVRTDPRYLALAGMMMLLCAGVAQAEDASALTSIELGRQLLTENGCNGSCHSAHMNGSGSTTIYTRTTRRVNSHEELRHQVQVCVSKLNAQIFPEDVDSLVTALDHDFYRFE